MELRINPDRQSIYPEVGVIIRGSAPAIWFRELSELNLSLRDVQLYPLPGTVANTLWGCLAEFTDPMKRLNDLRRNESCCVANGLLFVPTHASVYPRLSVAETSALLKGRKHFMHPEIGLVELSDAVDPASLVELPQENFLKVTTPDASEFIPLRIRSFMVKPLPPKEAIKAMEENLFPKTEPLNTKPLNVIEKAKLLFYRSVFRKTKNPETGKTEITHKPLFGFLRQIKGMFSSEESTNKWAEKAEQNFEDLEDRNQEQMERLIKMLRDNPEDALKYAIPIGDGTGRGPSGGSFDLSERWNTFSLFGNNSGGGGGGSFTSQKTDDLANEYRRIAEELIKKKDYRKAAFVYQKLLRQPYVAAETLEKGEIYPEAAAVFLEFVKNKDRAAQCYEKGNMTQDAIGLYKELRKNEKVGDLYIKLNKRNDANVYYELTADEYRGQNQFVKASLIYRDKMLKPEAGQEMLIAGWRRNQDATNCMGIYFSNIGNDKLLKDEYDRFYQDEVNAENRSRFIYVAAHEFNKRPKHADQLKTLAYEVAVAEIPKNPRIVADLQDFNKNDKQFTGDTLRFRNRAAKNSPGPLNPAAVPAVHTPPKADNDPVVSELQVQASFPGGEEAFKQFIRVNVRYPQAEKKQGKTGRVLIYFEISRDGSIVNVRTQEGVAGAPGFELEAERVIKSMPRWRPARAFGNFVKCSMTVPINFNLA